jgi:hypothetical protein
MEHEEFEQQVGRITDMDPVETPTAMNTTQNPLAEYPTPTQERPLSQPMAAPSGTHHQQQQSGGFHEFQLPDFDRFGTPGPPAVGPKPGAAPAPAPAAQSGGESQAPPQIRLPGVDGREDLDFWGDEKGDDDSWERDAIMHMNLMGDLGGGGPGRGS